MNKLVDLKCSQCGNLAGGNKRKIPVAQMVLKYGVYKAKLFIVNHVLKIILLEE